MPAKVQGADQLAASLGSAAKRIQDMPSSVHQQAGQLVAQAVARAAPRRTGRLASSFSAQAAGDGAQVSSSAPYAAFVNYGTRRMSGRQYVDRGLDVATDPVADVYQAEIDRALGQVRGA